MLGWHDLGDMLLELFWKQVYEFSINPVNGISMWSKSRYQQHLYHQCIIHQLGMHYTPTGRPKTNKIRRSVEVQCGKCRNQCHNQRSWKGQAEPSSQGVGASQTVANRNASQGVGASNVDGNASQVVIASNVAGNESQCVGASNSSQSSTC